MRCIKPHPMKPYPIPGAARIHSSISHATVSGWVLQRIYGTLFTESAIQSKPESYGSMPFASIKTT